MVVVVAVCCGCCVCRDELEGEVNFAGNINWVIQQQAMEFAVVVVVCRKIRD